MHDLEPTEELLARITILEAIAARLMAERFRATPDPRAECARWFEAAKSSHAPADDAPLAARAFRGAALRALDELQRSTEALLV